MKTQIKINPITNNFLDRNFQNMLLPYRCLQHMLFLSRFSIEYNCIRPHRASYYIFSFIGSLGFVIFHLHNLMTNDFEGVTKASLIVFIKINVFFLVIPFAIFYTLNVIQRKDHVTMVLKIQKAYRSIHYKYNKKTIIKIWVDFVRHYLFFIIAVSLTRELNLAVYFYSLLYFDVEITYGVSIIDMIRGGIIQWISEVEYCSTLCLELENEKIDNKLKRLFQAYTNLMEAFDVFRNIFKFGALFQAIDTFLLSLLYLQIIIELAKIGGSYFGTFYVGIFVTVTILWIVKNVTFVSVFCIYCEKFYMSVTDADVACCRLLGNLQSTVEAKRLCKNVRRLNRAAFHKMTACRMFTIDGRLPEKFNSLMVEYTVVLLQFAVMSWINGMK